MDSWIKGRRAGRACRPLGVVMVAVTVAGPVHAAEYYARAFLGQSLGYDDNPSFSFDETDKGRSITSKSSITLNAGARTPAFDFDTNSTLAYSAFPQETSLNSFDQFVNTTIARRFGLTRYGVRGSFIRDTTRTTDEEETGRFVGRNESRIVLAAGPFVETQIDRRNSLSANALYLNQHRFTKNLPDFEQWTGNAGWTHILTPRTQGQAAINGFLYNSNSAGSSESQSLGLSVGAVHQVSPRLSVRLLAGPAFARQRLRVREGFVDQFGLPVRDANSTSSSITYQVDSGLTYTLDERTSFGAGFNRSATPSTTSGLVTESNRVNLFANYDLLRTVSVGTTTSYNRRTQLASRSGNDDVRDIVDVSPRLSWQIQEDLRLTLSYRFRWQREDDTGDTTTSNGVFLTVNYELPRLLGDR